MSRSFAGAILRLLLCAGFVAGGLTAADAVTPPPVAAATTSTSAPYWIANPQGSVWNFGSAGAFGDLTGVSLNKPIVGITPTNSKRGYWLVATDGGIFTFGDARFFGSTGNIVLNRPIVGMAPTPTNNGYWLVASDGGIFTFGDAGFYGSAGGTADNSYAKILPAPDGRGYWLLRNGGDALAYGSVANASAAVAAGRPAVGLLHTINGPQDLALEYAMRQRGKPYAWGGAGPDSFDCSGLTLRAWQAAGVTLPRIANDQYDAGRRVPFAELKAGDLVFWADDVNNPRSIYHVALYLGGGNIITAPKPGEVVRSSPIWTAGLMPYGVRVRG